MTNVIDGLNFKQQREAKRYTQEELAELMGVSLSTLSRWERGVCRIPTTAWQALGQLEKQDDNRTHVRTLHITKITDKRAR